MTNPDVPKHSPMAPIQRARVDRRHHSHRTKPPTAHDSGDGDFRLGQLCPVHVAVARWGYTSGSDHPVQPVAGVAAPMRRRRCATDCRLSESSATVTSISVAASTSRERSGAEYEQPIDRTGRPLTRRPLVRQFVSQAPLRSVVPHPGPGQLHHRRPRAGPVPDCAGISRADQGQLPDKTRVGDVCSRRASPIARDTF
jgi:hypothetical protein